MDVKTLSLQTNISEHELVSLIRELNESHNLCISDTFTKGQYDILRSLLDSSYLINRLKMLLPRSDFEMPTVLDKWIVSGDLTGMSTTDIELIAAGGPYTGLKQVFRAMRANGYETEIVYLGNEQQGRRWFKSGEPDMKGAKAKAKAMHSAKHKSDVSFL